MPGSQSIRYQNVCLESLGYVLPDEIVSSDEIEARLAPIYERLRLPPGRLELMSGIRKRRFWPPGTLPSEMSIVSGREALEASGVAREEIGALVHASVCRDHLEPATASLVHQGLELSSQCVIYDVSNACLGFLNGMLQVANMIELGQIRAGLVVASEGSRELVENTIQHLNGNLELTRGSVKLAVASLTIGSASAAAVLTDKELSRGQTRLVAAVAGAFTKHNHLCRSGRDEAAADGMRPLMSTDSEALLKAGIAAADVCFQRFLQVTGWHRSEIDKTCCHQVGQAHRRATLQRLRLLMDNDFTTYEWLGNTGSVALPVTLALAAEREALRPGEQVALLGIGSGINCLMLGVDWQRVAVSGRGTPESSAHPSEVAGAAG